MNVYPVEIPLWDTASHLYGTSVLSDEGVFNRDREGERKNCCVAIGNHFCKGCINHWMYRIFFYWNNFWHLNCLKKKKGMLNVVNEQCLLFFFSLNITTVCLEIWNTNQGCILRLLLRVLKNFLHGLLSYETEVIYLRVWFKGHQKRQNIWHFPSKWNFCCYFEKTPHGSYVT